MPGWVSSSGHSILEKQVIQKQSIKLLILDCDGVMFDTSEANRTYYNRLLLAVGLPEITDEQFAFAQMHTVFESVDYLFKTPKLIEQAHQLRQQMSYASVIKEMRIEPSLKAVLKTVQPELKTAVATNRTDTMNRVLEEHGLTHFFDLVVTAMDVKRAKPHPDMLQKAMRHFEMNSSQSLFVGDSLVDQQAAEAADMMFAAFGNRVLTADLHVDRLDSLLPYLIYS